MLKLWNDSGEFPLLFSPLEGYQDFTKSVVDSLNALSKEVKAIFALISASLNRTAYIWIKLGVAAHSNAHLKGELTAAVDKLLCALGVRGILTLLGTRKTVASGDIILPDKQELIRKFNKPIAELTEEEKWKRKPVEKLTVGARALTKHAHRSSEVSSWAIISGRDSGEPEWGAKPNATTRRNWC